MEFDRVPGIAKYLSVIFLLSKFGMNTVWFFLPVFFERQIESVFLIGIMTSLPAAVPIILDIPVGNLVQRAGEKIVIFLGLVTNLVPGLLYITGLPALLVLGKISEGLVKTLIWNGGWSLSLKSSEDESESESVSVFLLGVNVAAIIGPMVGGYLIAAHGFNLTFALWAFSAWLAVLVFYIYVGLEGKHGFVGSLEELFQRKTYFDDYHHLKQNWENLKFPMSLIFLYSILFSFFWLAVPLLLERVGADFTQMGIIFGLAAMPKLFQFAFGRLADRIGKLKLVSALGILLAPVMAAMGVYSNIYIVGGLFLVARLFATGFSPPLHAFYDSRVPDELEGEMTGFLEFAKHSGQALGPFMAGTLASIWSVNASFFGAAAVTSLLFLLAFFGRNS
ncbi:MAG: MFS transporter [Candidatus Nanohaloarchaea archaeon]